MLFHGLNNNNSLEGRVFHAPDKGAGTSRRVAAKATQEDLIAMLENEDVAGFNTARKSFKGKLNLSGIQTLAGKDLTGVDLSDAILISANFTDTTLDGGKFTRSSMFGAIFNGVSAVKADFTDAKMVRASFSKGKARADLSESIFVKTHLSRATLDHAIFNSANMEGAVLTQAGGTSVSFDGANLIDAKAKLTLFDDKTTFTKTYVRNMIHDGFNCPKNLLEKAILSEDPPPGTFEYSAPEVVVSKLIDGIAGTNLEYYESAMDKLNKLIGLDAVKSIIAELADSMHMESLEARYGLPEIKLSQHYCFSGSAGTGKTTVGRIFGEILHSLGYLEHGHLVEVSRDKLVAGYKGQSAIKTAEVIESAMGGVLLIDEAYSLVQGEEDTFGIEARDVLLKAMEDHAGKFVVIFTGYTENMDNFIKGNPGLKSRISDMITFPDYNSGELTEIFQSMLLQRKREFDPVFLAYASVLFALEQAKGEVDFGNGRYVRNIFTDTVMRQRSRNAAKDGAPTADELKTFIPGDLPFYKVMGFEAGKIDLNKLAWVGSQKDDKKEYKFEELKVGMENFPLLSPESIAYVKSLQ